MWPRTVVRLSVRLSVFSPSCEHDISGTPWENFFKLCTSLTLTPDPDPWTRQWTWWSEIKGVSSSVCSDQSGNFKPYQSISTVLWQERDWKLNLKKHKVSGISFRHLQVLHHRIFPAVFVETKTWYFWQEVRPSAAMFVVTRAWNISISVCGY